MTSHPRIAFSEVAHRFEIDRAPRNPDVQLTRCPNCHDDEAVLLRSDGRVTIHCPEEECSSAEIAEALGITEVQLADLRDDITFAPSGPLAPRQIVWEEEFPEADLDNARLTLRNIEQEGHAVAFTNDAGWLRRTDNAWELVDQQVIRGYVHQVADRLFDASLSIMSSARDHYSDKNNRSGDERLAQAKRLTKASRMLRQSNVIDAVLKELPALPGVFWSLTDFDQDRDVLGVRNGVVDLRTGELRPYSREDKIIRQINVDYRPDARNPRWERFIDEIFVDADGQTDPELVEYMHRLIGYGITGHVSEQILPVLFGEGSNGKGVFIETLQSIFKAHTVTTPFSTFEARPSGGIPNDLAAMAGARLVMASEGEQGAPMAEAVIKRLVGGDTISARFMRKEFFEFSPTFLILLATNYKPNFRGQDFGLWRRVKLIPLRRQFTTADKDLHLGAKFVGDTVPANAWREGDDFGDGPEGILAWAIRGAMAWYANGLTEPAVIKQETTSFRTEQDRIGEFLATYFDVTGKRSDTVTLSKAWNAHHDWAEANRETAIRVKQTFANMLSERQGITRDTRPNGSVFFRGLSLLTDGERQAREHAEERAVARESRELSPVPDFVPIEMASEVS
jgi:putative DNA primase/helicase